MLVRTLKCPGQVTFPSLQSLDFMQIYVFYLIYEVEGPTSEDSE